MNELTAGRGRPVPTWWARLRWAWRIKLAVLCRRDAAQRLDEALEAVQEAHTCARQLEHTQHGEVDWADNPDAYYLVECIELLAHARYALASLRPDLEVDLPPGEHQANDHYPQSIA